MFSSNTWMISAVMRFSGNGGAYLSSLGAAAGAAEGKVDRVALAMTRLRDQTTMLAGGLVGLGIAFSVYGIVQAAKFELAMTGVSAATGATTAQFARLKGMAMSVSGITAQSNVTIASEMAAAASSGLNDPKRLMAAFPQMAKAADVMWLSPKHIDPVGAVTAMAKFSHLFAAYSGKPLHEMVDRATRLMYTQPENLQAAVTQGRMFIGPALRYGVSMHDIFTQLNTMGQTGYLRGRGGSGLARYMEYLMGAESLTSHMSKVRRASMIDLGVFDSSGRNKFIDPRGNLELNKSIDYLYRLGVKMTGEHKQAEFTTDLMNAFLAQGGRYISTITLPGVHDQVAKNELATAVVAPRGKAVDVLWKKYMGTTFAAWSKFVTNMNNVATDIFLPLLPEISGNLNNLADTLNNIGGWITANPDAAGRISKVIGALMAVSSLRFGLGMGMKALDLISGFSKLEGISNLAKGLMMLDNIAFAGIGSKLAYLGMRIAGLSGPAAAAASGVNGLGTAVGTLSGARAAAIGLTALGGAITAVTSAVAFWAGIAIEMDKDAKDPKRNAQQGWASGGANSGINPPGTKAPGPNTDAFGVPLQKVHIIVQDRTSSGISLTSKGRAFGQTITSPSAPALNPFSPNVGLAPH
jgi:TP901 family phage tail tape measure protein